MGVTIYHNPKCSKSRQTLSILRENGIKPEIIEYMNFSINASELKSIIKKLGVKPRDTVSSKEAKEEGIEHSQNGDDLIAAIVAHPRILQRPIVIKGKKAVIGRPPETVLEIL